MRIELKHKKEVATVVDVSFPFYRSQDAGGDDYSCMIYSKIELVPGKSRLVRVTSVTVRDGKEFEFEVETYSLDDWQGSDNIEYVLGRGRYACREETFRASCGLLLEAVRECLGQ